MTTRPTISARGPAVAISAPTPRVRKLENEITRAVTTSMKARLGITGNKKLPAEVDALVKSAAAVAAETALETAVIRDIQEATDTVTRASVLDRFDNKVADARVGLDHIAGSKDVEKILARRADMLAAKKAALEAAGFTSGEAMEILLADIAARGH